MSIVAIVLAVIYGQHVAAREFGGYRHLLVIVCLLSATMYSFIILAILVEGLGGIHGIFHAPGAGNAPMGMGIGQHIVGQLLVMVASAAMLCWVFCLPLALLIYLLFWKGFNPALSALAAAAALPVLMVIQKRKLISRSQWSAMLCGTGEALLPLLLIGAERLGSQRSALEAPKVEIGAQPAQRVHRRPARSAEDTSARGDLGRLRRPQGELRSRAS